MLTKTVHRTKVIYVSYSFIQTISPQTFTHFLNICVIYISQYSVWGQRGQSELILKKPGWAVSPAPTWSPSLGKTILVPSFHPGLTSTVSILSLILDVCPSSFMTWGITGHRPKSAKTVWLKLWNHKGFQMATVTLREILIFLVHPRNMSSKVRWSSLSIGGSWTFSNPGFRTPNWSGASIVLKSGGKKWQSCINTKEAMKSFRMISISSQYAQDDNLYPQNNELHLYFLLSGHFLIVG